MPSPQLSRSVRCQPKSAGGSLGCDRSIGRRPLWGIGNRAPGGEQAVNIARLWVEGAPGLTPGESATARLAPLCPGPWHHLKPGDVITMHEGMPVVGAATIIDVTPPAVPEHER